MIKIEMMRCLRAVAREGTLAAAAARLGRSPSAVSMMLAQLTESVGGPLFETDRKNRLTPLGRMVLEECERALDAFERAAEAIGRHARSTAGTVRIAAVPSAAVLLLPAAIRAFRARRPDVRLEIGDLDSAAVLRRVQFDEADIGIASAPAQGALRAEPLTSDRLGIVCRADSAVAARQAAGWAALGDAALVANPLCDLVDHPLVRRKTEDAALTARNTTTLLAFVRAGFGATILPAAALRDAGPEIVFFAPDNPARSRTLALLTSATKPLSPAARAFRAVLKSVAER